MRAGSWFVFALVSLAACGGGGATTDAGGATDAAIDHDAYVAPVDGGADAGAPAPTVIAELDGAMFQLPESVAYHGGLAYLSLLNGSVVTVDAAGTVTPFGSVPIVPAGSAYALGIAVASDGTVYLAMTPASATSTFAAGVYRIPAAGGTGALFASHPELFIPNDVDLDAAGNLYITADGRIYRMTGGAPGTAEIWLDSTLLASTDGTTGPCGMRTSPFPIGANGIAVDGSRVVVGNTETASVIAIPITASGAAGAPSVLAMDPPTLCGIDGLARDADGTFLAVVLGQSVVRISSDAATRTTVHSGLPLRTPAGVDVGDFGGRRQALVSCPDFEEAFGAGGPASAMPNLTAIPL
jgi:sugar lactone lactonase YvrE